MDGSTSPSSLIHKDRHVNPQPTPHRLRATDRIDLHTHTTYSDGHWKPVELFDHLASEGFALVAVTDHDRVDRIGEMQALGAERGIVVLPGVEVTTSWGEQLTHLLCYGFDPAGGALAAVTRQIREGQAANARAVYDELVRRGYAFPRQNDMLAETGGEIVRAGQNILLLREHGYVPDFAAGLQIVLDAGHRDVTAPFADAGEAARADGGITIIAHPGRSETSYPPERLEELRTAGLAPDGIEVYYPTYSGDLVRTYEAFVARHGWLASAGSDSHGPRQRLPIAYQAQQVADLLERCGIGVSSIAEISESQ
jgi:predicted metal-dependent phosphoesterase TrpH